MADITFTHYPECKFSSEQMNRCVVKFTSFTGEEIKLTVQAIFNEDGSPNTSICDEKIQEAVMRYELQRKIDLGLDISE